MQPAGLPLATVLALLSATLVAGGGCSHQIRPIALLSFADPQQAAMARAVNVRVEVSEGHTVNHGRAAALVDFPGGAFPQIVIGPPGNTWDWSNATALVLPVENREAEAAVGLSIHADEADRGARTRGSLSWWAWLPPGATTTLVLPFLAADPLSMGMQFGPPIRGVPLGAHVIRKVKGAMALRRVAAIRLVVPSPAQPRRLDYGEVGVIEGSPQGREAYRGIVDRYGQYSRQTWPGKPTSFEELQAQWTEEAQQVKQWAAELPARDRFGGIPTSPPLHASGFFRTEHENGRWWLVTPEGNRFFSVGVDAIRASVGATYIQGREFMFERLPGPKDAARQHFGESDSRITRAEAGFPGHERGGFDHGRWFNFYTANLERRHGPDWREAWRDMTLDRLGAWGFNTIGNWSEPELWDRGRIPYVMPLSINGDFDRLNSGGDWGVRVPDPFDPRFAAAVEDTARAVVAPRRNDRFLIGYFVDNELAWGPGDAADPRLRYGLAYGVLALGSESAAKAAFVHLLAARYGAPGRLAAAWGIHLDSWDELQSPDFKAPLPSDAHPEIAADLSRLTRALADAYFRTVADGLRRHDPAHLYLGSRFWTRTPEVVAACAQYCDVVSFNVYSRGVDGEPWRGLDRLAKPVIIGEFHFGSTDRGMFGPGLVDVGTEEARGTAYARYLKTVLDNPAFVGCHWFQYVDQPLTGRLLDGENHHIGLVSTTDVPYRAFVTAVRRANLEATGAVP
mgnify:FL=1